MSSHPEFDSGSHVILSGLLSSTAGFFSGKSKQDVLEVNENISRFFFFLADFFLPIIESMHFISYLSILISSNKKIDI